MWSSRSVQISRQVHDAQPGCTVEVPGENSIDIDIEWLGFESIRERIAVFERCKVPPIVDHVQLLKPARRTLTNANAPRKGPGLQPLGSEREFQPHRVQRQRLRADTH